MVADLEREERRTFPEIACFESIRPGMGERQVRDLVGQPDQMYEKASAPEHYYVEGYTYRKRPISNKVFTYWYGSDGIAYVWFDEQNRAESAYLGGS